MCNFRHAGSFTSVRRGGSAICVCAVRQAAYTHARSGRPRTDGARPHEDRIKARDCTHSQARMEGRSTDRSGAGGGVYTRHRFVPLARCEKHVAITRREAIHARAHS